MTRIKCPACERSAAVLSRKLGSSYRGLTLQDGSQLYACGYSDCHLEVFLVTRDGERIAGQAGVYLPALNRLTASIQEARAAIQDLNEAMPAPGDRAESGDEKNTVLEGEARAARRTEVDSAHPEASR